MGTSVNIDPQYDGIVMLGPEIVFFNDALPRPDGRKIYHVFEQTEEMDFAEDLSETVPNYEFELKRRELFSKASKNSLKNIQKVLAKNGILMQSSNFPSNCNALVSILPPQTLLTNKLILNTSDANGNRIMANDLQFSSSLSEHAKINLRSQNLSVFKLTACTICKLDIEADQSFEECKDCKIQLHTYCANINSELLSCSARNTEWRCSECRILNYIEDYSDCITSQTTNKLQEDKFFKSEILSESNENELLHSVSESESFTKDISGNKVLFIENVETGIQYVSLTNNAVQGNPIVIDSLGFAYSLRLATENFIKWRCNNYNASNCCLAYIKQTHVNFVQKNEHNHTESSLHFSDAIRNKAEENSPIVLTYSILKDKKTIRGHCNFRKKSKDSSKFIVNGAVRFNDPIKNTHFLILCSVCQINIETDQLFLECKYCETQQHLSCAINCNESNIYFRAINTEWSCEECYYLNVFGDMKYCNEDSVLELESTEEILSDSLPEFKSTENFGLEFEHLFIENWQTNIKYISLTNESSTGYAKVVDSFGFDYFLNIATDSFIRWHCAKYFEEERCHASLKQTGVHFEQRGKHNHKGCFENYIDALHNKAMENPPFVLTNIIKNDNIEKRHCKIKKKFKDFPTLVDKSNKFNKIYHCPICQLVVQFGQLLLKCKNCETQHHKFCVSISKKFHESSVVEDTEWKCPVCCILNDFTEETEYNLKSTSLLKNYGTLTKIEKSEDIDFKNKVLLGQSYDLIQQSEFIKKENNSHLNDLDNDIKQNIELFSEEKCLGRRNVMVLKYVSLLHGTKLGNPKVFDSLDYGYTLRSIRKDSVIWQCERCCGRASCYVSLLQQGSDFVQRNDHNHSVSSERYNKALKEKEVENTPDILTYYILRDFKYNPSLIKTKAKKASPLFSRPIILNDLEIKKSEKCLATKNNVTKIKYVSLIGESLRKGNPKVIDSLGYRYCIRNADNKWIIWQCTKRIGKYCCQAYVKQTKKNFELKNEHNHVERTDNFIEALRMKANENSPIVLTYSVIKNSQIKSCHSNNFTKNPQNLVRANNIYNNVGEIKDSKDSVGLELGSSSSVLSDPIPQSMLTCEPLKFNSKSLFIENLQTEIKYVSLRNEASSGYANVVDSLGFDYFFRLSTDRFIKWFCSKYFEEGEKRCCASLKQTDEYFEQIGRHNHAGRFEHYINALEIKETENSPLVLTQAMLKKTKRKRCKRKKELNESHKPVDSPKKKFKNILLCPICRINIQSDQLTVECKNCKTRQHRFCNNVCKNVLDWDVSKLVDKDWICRICSSLYDSRDQEPLNIESFSVLKNKVEVCEDSKFDAPLNVEHSELKNDPFNIPLACFDNNITKSTSFTLHKKCLDQSEETIVKYVSLLKGTKFGNPKVVDSLGFGYTLKNVTENLVTWECSKHRINSLSCCASLNQKGFDFVQNGEHNHSENVEHYNDALEKKIVENTPDVLTYSILRGRNITKPIFIEQKHGPATKNNQTKIRYVSLLNGTLRRGNPKLFDSLGYEYIIRSFPKEYIVWQCTKCSGNGGCGATVKQMKGYFEQRNEHNHKECSNKFIDVLKRKETENSPVFLSSSILKNRINQIKRDIFCPESKSKSLLKSKLQVSINKPRKKLKKFKLCSACQLHIKTDQKFLNCKYCKTQQHKSCIDLNNEIAINFNISDSDWSCTKCYKKYNKNKKREVATFCKKKVLENGDKILLDKSHRGPNQLVIEASNFDKKCLFVENWQTAVKYVSLRNGTSTGHPKVIDSLGFGYSLKSTVEMSNKWLCTKHNLTNGCFVELRQTGINFEQKNKHNHLGCAELFDQALQRKLSENTPVVLTYSILKDGKANNLNSSFQILKPRKKMQNYTQYFDGEK